MPKANPADEQPHHVIDAFEIERDAGEIRTFTTEPELEPGELDQSSTNTAGPSGFAAAVALGAGCFVFWLLFTSAGHDLISAMRLRIH